MTEVELQMTEAQRMLTGGEAEQEIEDRTKPDWPGATSGPVVTPATAQGMW